MGTIIGKTWRQFKYKSLEQKNYYISLYFELKQLWEILKLYKGTKILQKPNYLMLTQI